MPGYGIKWTEEQIKQVGEMRKAGVSIRNIAKAVGHGLEAVDRLCRKHNFPSTYRTTPNATKMNEGRRKPPKITLPPLASLQMEK